MAATATAFVVCGGDTVQAWGHPDNGGDARKVLSALRNVSEVQATRRAFAMRSRDGCVVTWGDVESGGDCSEVQDQLRNVEALQSSLGAFAALKEGSIITWGDKETGGDSSHVQEQLRDVQHVQATHFAFAAITSVGGVVTWGDPVRGGDSSGVQDQLYDIQPLGEADPVSSASGWPFSSKQQEISLRQIHGLIVAFAQNSSIYCIYVHYYLQQANDSRAFTRFHGEQFPKLDENFTCYNPLSPGVTQPKMKGKNT